MAEGRGYPWKELEPALQAWGVELSEDARARLTRYLDVIREINAKTNLTAEDDPASLLLRHAADGLAGAAIIRRLAPQAKSLADQGAGGGFIGVGLKLALPALDVTLVESLQRKYDALNRGCLAVGLPGLRPLRTRIEAERGPGKVFDVVVERAFAPLPEALAFAAAWLAPGGLFVAWQSSPPEESALHGRPFKLLESWAYRLPRETKDRHLAAFRREGEN